MNRLARAPTLRRRGLACGNRIETLEGRRLLAMMFFDGGGGTNQWNNPDNWSLHRLPTAQDDVWIGYTFNVELAGAPAAVQSLTLRDTAALSVATGLTIGAASETQSSTTLDLLPGGTLGGAGDLYVFGEINWTGGAMEDAGRTIVGVDGRAFITGPDSKVLRRTLRIDREAQIAQGDLNFEGARLEIGALANVLITDAQLVNAAGVNRIDNAGNITTEGWLVRIGVSFHHTGTTLVSSNLDLTGGGSATGSFEMFAGVNRMLIGSPGYLFEDGSRIFGDGAHLWVNGGPTTIAEPTSLTALTVSGGWAEFAQNLDVTGVTHVEAHDGELRLLGPVNNLTTIQVETGGEIKLVGDGTHVLRTTYPGITEQGYLDVGREAVIFDYLPGHSSLFDVRGKVTSGYFDGTWVGAGLCSAIAGTTGAALGYGEASALFATFPATFMGQAVDDSAVLVRYTRWGDANLDGTVNLLDFNRLAAGFGASDAYWTQGEFNYDQSVTLADFNLLAGNFGQSVSAAAAEPDEVADLLA
jgi:hypothetical protein